MPARILVTILIAAFVALFPACTKRAAEKTAPNILLVTIDTLRVDRCSAFGYEVPTTPVMEKLAATGVKFTKAYAPTSTTAPSHAALLTSKHPRSLGVLKNGEALAAEDLTLAEYLYAEGYRTAAFVSSLPVKARYGFGQGFDHYDDSFILATASMGRRKGRIAHDRIGAATVDALEDYLDASQDSRPLFVWLHLVDPHAPYRAPVPLRARWPRGTRGALRRYDAEVHYADSQLGRALDAMSAIEREAGTIVVVTSDHGEGLGDHGWVSHGINLYEEAVRVPLVMRWPHMDPSGVQRDDPVTLIDIAPTIVSLLGKEIPADFDGLDVRGEVSAERPIFMQRREFRSKKVRKRRVAGSMYAVVRAGRKYINAPQENGEELYDLTADPGELNNLATSSPGSPGGVAAGLYAKELLAAIVEQWRERFALRQREHAPLSKAELKALRALGYVD